MDSVLLVSSSDKTREFFTQLLRADKYSQITAAGSGSEARRLLAAGNFDLILINAPLSDEFGHELSVLATESTSAGVILIVKSEVADDVAAKVEDFGVFVMAKPIGRQLFYQSLKLVEASRRRLLGLRDENIKLQNKVEEIRLINRAKCVLIQYLNMTEPQAHRYIEKQAMDMRITRREVALGILKTYES